MKAVITGASSGIGRDMARVLARQGWQVFLVARNTEKMLDLQKELGDRSKCMRCDVSHRDECESLYNILAAEKVDMLINCAGFGLCGRFLLTDLDTELEMIDTNIKAVHILTKLFLRDFEQRGHGYILNVASIAGFMPGPMMATYYATKNYVVSLTEAIYTELKKRNSPVKISVFCPGPVNTNFNQRAGVKFAINGIDSRYAARYAIDKALRGKTVIIPTAKIKLARFGLRFLPDKAVAAICFRIQRRKKYRGEERADTEQ